MTRRVAAALALALTACQITPGLTVKCNGRCHVYPASVGHRPAPGDPIPAR